MHATDISYMVSKFDWLSRDSLIMHHFMSLCIFNGIIIHQIQNDQHIALKDRIGDEQSLHFCDNKSTLRNSSYGNKSFDSLQFVHSKAKMACTDVLFVARALMV